MTGEKDESSHSRPREPSQPTSEAQDDHLEPTLIAPARQARDQQETADVTTDEDEAFSALRAIVRDELQDALSRGALEISVSEERSVRYPSTGPFPPQLISEWAKLDPLAPGRLLTIQETEQKFRHFRTYVGQANGTLSIVLGTGIASFLIAEGQYVSGLIAFLVGSGGPSIGPLIKYVIDRMPRPQLTWTSPSEDKKGEKD